MSAALTLWGHSLAALFFGALALAELRRGGSGAVRAGYVAALALTTLWALAVAGIDPTDVSAQVGAVLRDLAWLVAMWLLVRRDRLGGHSLSAVYAAVGVTLAMAGALAVVEQVVRDRAVADAFGDARLVLRAVASVGIVMLAQQMHAQSTRGDVRIASAALGAFWTAVLALVVWSRAQPSAWPMAVAVQGALAIALAVMLTIAGLRVEARGFAVSRIATTRLVVAVAVVAYAAATALAANLLAALAPTHARAAQTAIVFGSTAALLALGSTPWLRAWLRVKVAKHLFRHRYDYRTAWQRFADALSRPGSGAEPLPVRVVRALADLTGSPAAVLMVASGEGMAVEAEWRWGELRLAEAEAAALPSLLRVPGRIVALGTGEDEAVPASIRERPDGWAIVPLEHGGMLIGAILLARPPVARALDWEDFDLLRVAGRQAASYLAEDRAHAALADAQRFEEFNRRFAFIMHDIKNLVSQLSLVARNAERHADNPAFRADMVATLNGSADRMNALLARLSQHHGIRGEAARAIDVAALLTRIAKGRRGQHPIVVEARPALALAPPAALEQVVGHLVQNAIEASAADTPVTLRVASLDDRVAIEIADRGVGMAPAFVREQLFRPFASSKPGGFGIGAFEARQLVEAMGGTIRVDSREGEGTRFTVLIPLADALEAAA